MAGDSPPRQMLVLGAFKRIKGAVSIQVPSMTATLSSTGVTAGSYTNANITVGADGRLTAASTGSSGGISGSGSTGQVTYWNGSSSVTGSAQFTYASGVLTLGASASGGSIVLNGSSSGTVTLQPASGAGTGTIFQFPNANAISGQLIINQGSNANSWITLSGDATLANTGALTLATVNTNVGSYTNASITVNAKGLITACSSGAAPVTGTGVSGEVMLWSGTSTAAGDAGFTYNSSTDTITLGESGTSGSLAIKGSTSGTMTLTVNSTAGTVTWTAPTVNITEPTALPGTSGALLLGSTAGALTFENMSGDATLAATGAITLATVNTNVGTYTNASVTVNAKGLITAISSGIAPVTGSGTSGQVTYWNGSSTITGSAAFTFSGGTLTLGVNGTSGGALTLEGATSGSNTISVPATAGSGTTFTLPTVPWTGPTTQAPNAAYMTAVNASGQAKYVPYYPDPFAYAAFGGA